MRATGVQDHHPVKLPGRFLALLPALALPLICCDGGSAAISHRAEIRYMAWGSPEQMVLEQQLCDRFNRLNPDVHVRLLMVPGSAYRQKMILMLASRTAPDVIRVDHYDFPNLVQKGYFKDVAELEARDQGFHPADFFPMTLQEGCFKRRPYGLNTMFGAQVMYYNQTLFRQAGLADPYELAQRGAWTYQRFRLDAIAMTLTDRSGRPTQFGVQIPPFPGYVPFLWGFGADLLSQNRDRCTMDSKAAVAAIQFLADLRWKDRCCPSPAQSEQSAFSFESGKIGMVFNWSGMSVRYRKVIKNFEWDVCPMPAGPVIGSSMVKGNQLVIYRESSHPAEAWRLIRFLTSPEVETDLYANQRRNCPTRVAVAHSRRFLDGTLSPHHPDVFVSSVEKARELPITDRWQDWTTPFNSEMDDLLSGRNLDVGNVLIRATKAANKALAQEESF